jgi:hypothetical protein
MEGSAPPIRVRGFFRSRRRSVEAEGAEATHASADDLRGFERRDASPAGGSDLNPGNGWHQLSIAVSLKYFGMRNPAGAARQ